MCKRIIFISDLHLDPTTPHITQQFLQLLQYLNGPDDHLYILGDLFEQWIGDDDESEFTRSIIHALQHAESQGTPIFILPGNRDFLLGKQFFRQTKCVLLPDEAIVNAFGTKLLLMHGDTLCIHDVGYQFFRKLTRNCIFKFLYTALPLTIRSFIANMTRKQSKKHTKYKSATIMDVAETAVISTMRKHDVAYLIHGHTHKPNIHVHQNENLKLTRIVLAAWHDVGSAYVWDENMQQMVALTHLAK